jgi:hypothetical protein
MSGTYKSTMVSHPYNQGRKHPSMEAEYDDRVHSGGLPTLTVHKYSHYLTVVRSQSKKYKVQGCGVPSRAIKGKVKGFCPHQLALFGV